DTAEMCGIACLMDGKCCTQPPKAAVKRHTMDNARVTGVRSIELGVTNLDRAAAFYNCVWGLEPVAAEHDSVHLRANSTEHHIVTLRERPQAAMLGVHFAAQDRNAVNALHARAKAFG